ncbi:hypothetical protein [Escherichia coli]|uniref:hypothetical protein n=1 Tax=Escherichia coli TaxID=562 RepID=UPI001FCE6D98|nr:hypothetical protein [Escherichia coli]
MWMLKKGFTLALLVLFSLPATAGLSLEETARKVIIGFQQEDAQLINSLIDKKTGLYVLFQRGASMDVENFKSIDFKTPVPEYLLWPSAGEHIPRDEEFDKKTIPEFDCERGWNKHGYFISSSDTHIKSAVIWSSRRCLVHRETLFLMRRLPQRVEWSTGPCVWSLRQKRVATDWYFI